MKQLSKPIRVNLLSFFMSVFCLFLSINTVFSQNVVPTYCVQFTEPDLPLSGPTFKVDVFITGSSLFQLGNFNLNFTYNTAALSLPTVVPYTTTLPSTYTTSVQKQGAGVVNLNATYNGTVAAGKSINGATRIVSIIFTVVNPLINPDFKLLNNGVKNINLLKSDNTTLLVPSAQCPPSPYTSFFYDANIDLNADIPMNECVESTTLNSVKLNFGNDETREILPVGFKFKFYCEEVTSLKVGFDGALLVNAATNATLPMNNSGKLISLPRVISPLWNGWQLGTGTINCLLKDTMINLVSTRMLIVQWNNVSPVDEVNNLNTDPLKATFNVILFENSSIIKFNYKDVEFISDLNGNPNAAALLPVATTHQNGLDGSVGIKGICSNGIARDKVNNIVFDGPEGVSLKDLSSGLVYKSIIFLPITGSCEVPALALDTMVCQNSTSFKFPFASNAVNGTWQSTPANGLTFLSNKNIENTSFNPSTAGNYKLTWDPGCPNFSYMVRVNVTEKPVGRLVTAPNIRQCGNPNFTVIARTPTAGTGKWEKITGAGIFSTLDTSATIIGVPEGGVSFVRWIVSNGTNCNDTIVVTLTNNPRPIVALDKTLIEQCDNPSFMATGIFSGTATASWSILKGLGAISGSNTGTKVTVNGVTADSTTILQLLVIEGTCSTIVYDTLKNYKGVKGNVLTPNPFNQCSNPNFIVTANTPSAGTWKWEKVSGLGTITASDTSATILGVQEVTTTVVRFIVANGNCSDTVVVNLNNISKPLASVEKSLIEQCNIPNFSAKGIYSGTATGTWSILKGPGTIVGSNTGINVTVNGVLADSTTILQFLVIDGQCSTIVNDTLKNYSKPPATLVTASPLRQCNNPTFSIAAVTPSVPIIGTGVWTRVSGVGTVGVGNPTTVTDVSAGFTTVVRWKTTNGVCSDSVDLTLINFIQPQATLITNSLITKCGVDSFTVQGGSIPSSFASLGVWSKVKGPGTIGLGNPAKVIGVSGDSTTVVQWTIVNGVCVDSVRDTLKNAIFVTPQLVTPANIEQCDNSTFNVVAKAPLAGTGSWSIESGLGVISGTGNAITVSGVTAGSTTVLNWKVVNDVCKDSVKVTLINRNPIKASLVTQPLIQKCNASTFIVEGVQPISGTGAWSIVSGPGTLSIGNPATIMGVSADSTTVLKWTITSGVCTDSILTTLKNFKFVPAEISTANPLSQCDNPVFNINAVNPSSGTGTWSILSGSGILTGTNPVIVNNVTAGTPTVAQWKVVNGECKDSATITLRNDVKPTDANAGINKLNCDNSTFTMTANTPSVPILGTGTWTLQSGSSAIVITNPNSPTTTVTGVPVGTSATLKWTIVNGSCTTSALVQLTNSVLPVANAGADITQCPNTIFTLTGSAIPVGGTGVWSIIGASNNAIIANLNSPTATVTGLNANSEVKIEWKLTSQNGCTSRDTVVLKTFEALNPNAGADQIGCSGTFTLAATNPVGKWTIISSNSPLNFVDDTKPNTQVSNVSPGGTVVLKWTISNANCSASDTVQLYYDNAPPVPFIKKDTIYCNLDSFLLCSGRFKDTLKAVDTNNPNALFFNWSLYKDPNSSLTPLLSGNTPFIDVTLDTGSYVIAWRVMDGCGNAISFQYYKLRIKDCVPPAIDVYDKRVALSGSIEFNLGGEAKICVSHILKSVGDNCTDVNTLKRNLVLVRDDLNPTRKYSPDFTQCINVSCADVNKTVPLQVWTVDKAGTPGFIISNIYVADNIGVCGTTPQPLTSLLISSKTDGNIPIQNVKITGISGNSTDELSFGNSATNGFLTAEGLTVGNQYQFKAVKTDEAYMGVTTFDIALISRHILGLETINSPYGLLAADVNEDGEIDATDIIELRNFVLRRVTDLPRRSWRFVDSSYVIQNRTNPFLEDIPEVISIGNLTPNMQKAFKGIKKGDVSGSTGIKPNLLNLQERQSQILSITTDDIAVEKGQSYSISFAANGFNASSYQFTLGFTEGVAQIQSIQIGNLPNMGNGNFGLFKNALTTSWNGAADMNNPQLFTLYFTAIKTGKLSEMLIINNTLTAVEAISKEGKPLAVELKFNHSGVQEIAYSLYQNHPNPFDKETTIVFNLPTETSAQLTVYSLDGRILYTQKDNFKAGKHEIKIDKKDINSSGVLYYRLDTPDFTTTRKMVLIK